MSRQDRAAVRDGPARLQRLAVADEQKLAWVWMLERWADDSWFETSDGNRFYTPPDLGHEPSDGYHDGFYTHSSLQNYGAHKW